MNLHPIPEPIVDTIKERLRRGDWSRLEIAKDLGLSRNRVDKIARDHGFSKRSPANSVARRLFPNPRLRGDLHWMDRAHCLGWKNFTELPVQDQKSVCRHCPVRLQCLEYGMAGPVEWTGKGHPQEGTVYGGLAPYEMARLKRERRGAREAS